MEFCDDQYVFYGVQCVGLGLLSSFVIQYDAGQKLRIYGGFVYTFVQVCTRLYRKHRTQ